MNTQWKLVPVEPTETMVINGFESEPDECFTDEEVWEQYQEMSGCQQAAFRAKLCWAAMINSAPASSEADAQPVMKLEAEKLWGGHGEYAVSFVRAGWLDECRATGGEFLLYTHPDEGKVARLTAERDALQQRLNAADQRIDELTAEPRVESVCRGSAALGTACGKCARCASLRLAASVKRADEKIPGMIATACGNFAIMIDKSNSHYGWTFRHHPDGMWVSGRLATEAEMNAARAHAKILALL